MLEVYRHQEQLIDKLPRDLAIVYKRNNTPDKLQWYLSNHVKYQYGKHIVSPYQGFLNGDMDCFSGMLFASLGLATQGLKPWNIMIVANKHDVHHNITGYEEINSGLCGSLAKSRDPNLEGRPPIFETPYKLVMSYEEQYLSVYKKYSDERTMIGFSDMIDVLDMASLEVLLARGKNDEGVLKLYHDFTNNVGWFNIRDGSYRRPIKFDKNEDVIL